MSGINLEVPVIDKGLLRDMRRIRQIVRPFTDAIEGDSSELEERLNNIQGFPQELTQDIIAGKLSKGGAFSLLLSRYLLSGDKVRELTRRWAEQEIIAEGTLLDFVQNYLVKHFVVDADGHPVDYHYKLHVEGRCPREECNGHVSEWEIVVDEPVSEQEFYYESSGIYFPTCELSRRGDLHQTIPISSVNMAVPKEPAYIVGSIHWRLKSGGRLLDKLVDHLMKERGGISDYAAARMITTQTDDLERDKQILSWVLNTIKESYGYGRRTFWDDRIEYRNIDEKFEPLNPDEEQYSIKVLPRFIEVIVPVKGIEIGLQLMTSLWHKQMEESRELEHLLYVERQEKNRLEKWTNYDRMLKLYLEPVFNGQ